MRTNLRDRRLMMGYLLLSLTDAAHRLWPAFVVERPEIQGPGLAARSEAPEVAPFIPTWRRDRGQTLAEYALILALIAVIAIVSLIFLGNAITAALSEIGASI